MMKFSDICFGENSHIFTERWGPTNYLELRKKANICWSSQRTNSNFQFLIQSFTQHMGWREIEQWVLVAFSETWCRLCFRFELYFFQWPWRYILQSDGTMLNRTDPFLIHRVSDWEWFHFSAWPPQTPDLNIMEKICICAEK